MNDFASKEKERAKRSAVRTALNGVPVEDDLTGQEAEKTPAGEQNMAEIEKVQKKEKQTDIEPKKKNKAGRPPLTNREKKARYSFTILPSLYEKAQRVAYENGKTLSELITEFLTEYVNRS